MDRKESITNEGISKKFKSQFELVNYAITLADNMIQTGRGPRTPVDTLNPSIIVLAEISNGKDIIEKIIACEKEIDDEREPVVNRVLDEVAAAPVRKKQRKIFAE